MSDYPFNYKTFTAQFRECRANGVVKDGPQETNQLAFPKRLNGKLINEITSTVLMCGRFGGRCSSGQPECRELRGAPPRT